ncbi:cell division protein FtsQ/DivIB [Phytoactinopolyspora mesophila]|uniref:FtsQ-type POTRA domain-containing protein n=1 Tax=Phytoactinopolyspora mesophila TaxID=2650750 RepID=A0A7K3M7N2_9ACTN|nr:FtsQ-type POTRA domain-containing protein [Phytoactinopolyspora mesophila]NDL59190.1 FtsQ-type POTRA domain-containing protein [Phytoactinopolyspora mesophila]
MSGTRSVSAERFAARLRQRRKRRVGLALLALFGAAVVGAGGWLVGWSSVLAVQDVRITGVEDEKSDEVSAVAEVPIGVPLIRVDSGEVADRVRGLPEVGDVRIKRSWPSTLTIAVEPRIAEAAVPDGSRWWSVDESGTLFDRSDQPADGVPVLIAPTEDSAVLARAIGVEVLTGLPARVEEIVASVEVESAADVRLILDDDVTVRWGTADRGEDKAAALLALIEDQEEQPSGYDVSAPDRPVVVP